MAESTAAKLFEEICAKLSKAEAEFLRIRWQRMHDEGLQILKQRRELERVRMERDELQTEVNKLSDKVQGFEHLGGVARKHLADRRALQLVLGLTDKQLGMIGLANDKEGAAQRELHRAGWRKT